MKIMIRKLCLLIAFMLPSFGMAELSIGIGKADITPILGTPSAGYSDRKGERMDGMHDPLLALALFIDNGEKKVVFCSVDHLGFTYEMVQAIQTKVHNEPKLDSCEVYIGSSHTHSGGGAHLNIPILGESLAGTYDPEVRQFYIDKTTDAIIQASQNLVSAKIGIGYGKAGELSRYRGTWPKDILPLADVSIIKVTKLDDTPLAVLFNYPVHPTVLTSQNRQFSADFVGYARDHLQTLLGGSVQAIYFNGAQGDIVPLISNEANRFDACAYVGKSLADTVQKIWSTTQTSDSLSIITQKLSYSFQPQATPFGLVLPIASYPSEMSLIVLNHVHAFLTIPGELSCIYDRKFKEIGCNLGYNHVSIFGLINDAHGYIILPESWRHKGTEAGLSFGGENYGDQIQDRAQFLLKSNASSLKEYKN